MVFLVAWWPTVRKYWSMSELCVSRGKYFTVVNYRHGSREEFFLNPEFCLNPERQFVAVAAA